ncbi:MAG: DUF1700 domain-containing protein [Clostridia bacterium]|nr:DUF1700 domain-containing protein [Clostridia bacterium]
MNKQDFFDALREKLAYMPKQDIEERISFYSEMIDDYIEEGCTEQEAVSKIGSVNEIADQIAADIPLSRIANSRIKATKKFKAWEIVLLALGSPIWLSLALALLSVIISIYAVLWAVVISVWAVFGSLVACGVCGTVVGGVFAIKVSALTGLAIIGAGIACAGLSIFLFFGCTAFTNCILLLTKKIVLGIKKLFIKKEVA